MTNVNHQNDVSKETIANAIKEYCTIRGFSQRELAVKSGVSDGTINKVINKKWSDISETMWRKLWNAVSDGRKAVMINTRDNQSIKETCKTARREKLMIGLTGDTGMGKTTSLKYLSRQRNTYYVSYDKTMRAKQFFSAILKEMGIDFEGSIHDMVNKIADELNVLSNPLLIIDESGKISHNVLLYIHVLRDKTDRNCGIVLAGMPYFKTNLQKLSNKQKEGMAEFLRRVNLWHDLVGLTRPEIELTCIQYGITDKDEQRLFFSKKRFGDLINEITLYQIDDLLSTLND